MHRNELYILRAVTGVWREISMKFPATYGGLHFYPRVDILLHRNLIHYNVAIKFYLRKVDAKLYKFIHLVYKYLYFEIRKWSLTLYKQHQDIDTNLYHYQIEHMNN